MFDTWDQVINYIKKHHKEIDVNKLSPQLKEDIIPYLIEENLLDALNLSTLICELFPQIIRYSNENTDLVGSDYIIANNTCYFINPLDKNYCVFNIYHKFKNTSNSFDTFGIIDYDNEIFKTDNSDQVHVLSEESQAKNYVNKILETAISIEASDIHISARSDNKVYFRFRKDGSLKPKLVPDMDFKSYSLFATSLLQKANASQEGFNQIADQVFTHEFNGRPVQFRLNMTPLNYKHDGGPVPMFVLRVNQMTTHDVVLSSLGLSNHTLNTIKSALNRNSGMIIVTGPTGSGKTTLLYGCLAEIRTNTKGSKSIQTIEDPVEKQISGVDAISVSSDENSNLTFIKASKAALRKDPDVVLIGEIRDAHVANEAINLAATGHLSLSTLHSDTSFGVINRLLYLGVDKNLLFQVISGIINTRLVAKVCPHCSREIAFDIAQSQYKDITPEKVINIKEEGDGCIKCAFVGYKGRHSVTEVITFNKKSKLLIADGMSGMQLENEFNKNNSYESIWQQGFDLLTSGVTTLTELECVLPDFE